MTTQELPTKGGGRKFSFYKNIEANISDAILRNPPKRIEDTIVSFNNGKNISDLSLSIIRDLGVLGLITLKNGKYRFTEGDKIKDSDSQIILFKQAYKIAKVKLTTLCISNGRQCGKYQGL